MAFFRDYLVFEFNFSLNDAIALCRETNSADETETIWSKRNLTSLPFGFFRDKVFSRDLEDFRGFLLNPAYDRQEVPPRDGRCQEARAARAPRS